MQAAREELAARFQIEQIRDRAGYREQTALAGVAPALRQRAQQALRVGVGGPREQVVNGGILDHAAGVHHCHAAGGLRHHPQIVRDQHDRHPDAALQLLKQLQHLGLNGDVEGGGGLVGDQQLRLSTGQSNGDHHALAHAAREVVRIARNPLFG